MNSRLFSAVRLLYPRLICLQLFLLIVLAGNVSAQTTLVYNVVPGSQALTDLIMLGGTKFTAFLEAGRSYTCEVQENIKSNNDMAISSSAVDPNGTLVTLGLIGDVTPTNSAGDPDNLAASRVTLTPSVSGFYVFTVTSKLDTSGVDPDPSQSGRMRITCAETTLYGGFNTVVNGFNFLEVTNLTAKQVVFTITALNAAGSVVINALSFGVAANSRTDIDLHSLVGSTFGSLRISHNGPFGGIGAAVSQYLVDSNGSFTLSVSMPAKPRENQF